MRRESWMWWMTAKAIAVMPGFKKGARHRAVHNALGPDLMGRIHALALDLDE